MNIEIINRRDITPRLEHLEVKYNNKVYSIIIHYHLCGGEYKFYYLNGDKPNDIDFEYHILCNL